MFLKYQKIGFPKYQLESDQKIFPQCEKWTKNSELLIGRKTKKGWNN